MWGGRFKGSLSEAMWRFTTDESDRRLLQVDIEGSIAHVELRGLMLKGVVTLAEAMEDPDPRIRLRAARAALHIGLKAIDLQDIQQRLHLLAHPLTLWPSRRGRR